MTTKGINTNKLFKDMGAVFTPVFYIFGIVAIASAIIVNGFEPVTVITALFLLFLAACAAADINKGIVPDLMVILIALLALVKFFTGIINLQSLISCILGSLVMSVPMLIAALILKNSFGGGDIKMMSAAGLFLGLDKTIIAGLIAFLIAGCYGVYLLFTKKRSAKEKVKLAPYLALGCAFSELFGSAFLEILHTFI